MNILMIKNDDENMKNISHWQVGCIIHKFALCDALLVTEEYMKPSISLTVNIFSSRKSFVQKNP